MARLDCPSRTLECQQGLALGRVELSVVLGCCADSVWLQSGCTPQGFHCKVGCFALSRSAILARLEAVSYAPIAHFPPELLKDHIITKVRFRPHPPHSPDYQAFMLLLTLTFLPFPLSLYRKTSGDTKGMSNGRDQKVRDES